VRKHARWISLSDSFFRRADCYLFTAIQCKRCLSINGSWVTTAKRHFNDEGKCVKLAQDRKAGRIYDQPETPGLRSGGPDHPALSIKEGPSKRSYSDAFEDDEEDEIAEAAEAVEAVEAEEAGPSVLRADFPPGAVAAGQGHSRQRVIPQQAMLQGELLQAHPVHGGGQGPLPGLAMYGQSPQMMAAWAHLTQHSGTLPQPQQTAQMMNNLMSQQQMLRPHPHPPLPRPPPEASPLRSFPTTGDSNVSMPVMLSKPGGRSPLPVSHPTGLPWAAAA